MKSILVLLCTLSMTAFGQASQSFVKKVKTEDKVVVIDVGSNNGVKIGTKVCFSSQDAQVTCGEVIRTLGGFSYVGVSSEKIRLVKVGMRASVIEVTAPIARKDPIPIPATENSEQPIAVAQESHFPLKALYLFSPMTVTSHRKLIYKPSSETLWSSQSRAVVSPLGLGLETKASLFKLPLAFGMRFKHHITSDSYVNLSDTDTVKTSISELSLGAYSEVLLLSKLLSIGTLNLGAGIDGDVSSVRVIADKKTETGVTPFADARSLLGVAAIRTSASFEIPMNPIGFVAGLNLMLPLFQLFNAAAATVSSDPLPTGKGLGLDLKDSLDHKKNQLALELFAGINVLF